MFVGTSLSAPMRVQSMVERIRCRSGACGSMVGSILLALCLYGSAMAQEYYVSVDGDDGATGTTLAASWRHCAYAASRVVAGDTVHVKAGNYGYEEIVFAHHGASGSPITVSGYTLVPGDAPAVGRANAADFPRAVLPLLDGGDSTHGTAFNLVNRRYIVIKNFQMRNYEVGVYAYGAEDVRIENIAGASFGDVTANYSGVGIGLGSYANNNVIENCSIFNACAEGFSILGDNNHLLNCHSACDNNSTGVHRSTDYYIVVAGNDNVLERCEVHRIGNLGHWGHGIGVKGDCTRNRITDCLSINLGTGFYVRHRGSVGNIFERCRADASPDGFGFVVRDGASDNLFTACSANGCYTAVGFYDSTEDDGAQYAGQRNTFAHCLFTNSGTSVIDFDPYDQATIADDNRFVNCTISGGSALFVAGRENRNNTFLNCIIADVSSFKTGAFSVDAPMQYCDFWNCGFAMPAGTGNFSADPRFAAPTQGNFHLQSAFGRWNQASQSWLVDGATSPCIDAGDPTSPFNLEPAGNGGRINLGHHGNTVEASRSSAGPTSTATISVSATSVTPGGQVTVTVSGGPGNLTDWVGLFNAVTPVGGAEVSGFWSYLGGAKTPPATGLSSATLVFTMPSAVGSYDFRFFPNDGYTPMLARSITVTVVGIAVSATSVAPGGQVTVTVAGGPGNVTDWVGLFDAATPVGGAEVAGFWSYLGGTKTPPATGLTSATLVFTMPSAVGSYDIRFLANNSYVPMLARSATITVVAPGNGLPPGWSAQDVGSVGAAGSTSVTDGTWTVAGSGADIWKGADGFRFAYRQMSGDVRITARVAGLENTNAWAKAGVMLRSALSAGSPHGSTFATSANGVAYQRRLTTDVSSGHTAGPFLSAPVWVRLERVGSTLTSSTSADGSAWTVIRSETVQLGSTISVGLAVTSHADGRVCTATFTNVEVVGAAAAVN